MASWYLVCDECKIDQKKSSKENAIMREAMHNMDKHGGRGVARAVYR